MTKKKFVDANEVFGMIANYCNQAKTEIEQENYWQMAQEVLRMSTENVVAINYGNWTSKHEGVIECPFCYDEIESDDPATVVYNYRYCPVCGARLDPEL